MQSLLSFFSLFNLPLQLLMGLHSFREIPRNFSEADQLATRLPHGSDDHVRPKSGPILPHSPAFVFESSVLCRYGQLPLRFAVSQVFFGIKTGEMLADNLVRTVALQPFGSSIPTGHI